jgi:hypothetical protein
MVYLLPAVLVGLLWACLAGPGRALATTGNTTAVTVPARYSVPRQIAKRYLGQYVLKAMAGDTPVSSGQMEIEINTLGYLQGVGSFYGYDAHGHQISWVATFYNFHLTGPNAMALEVFDVTGTHVLGAMRLQRSSRGDLSGQIALPTKRYPVQFRLNIPG